MNLLEARITGQLARHQAYAISTGAACDLDECGNVIEKSLIVSLNEKCAVRARREDFR